MGLDIRDSEQKATKQEGLGTRLRGYKWEGERGDLWENLLAIDSQIW